MTPPINRRRFLRGAAAGLGAVTLNQFLTACGANEAQTPQATSAAQPVQSTSIPPTAIQAKATQITASAGTQAPSTSQPTTIPATSPDLVVARSGEPEAMVRRAIAALGGMERFVPRNAKVIVKPNICVAYHTYEYAATTNPWVVGALVKLCLEAGARSVQVMDLPFGGTAEEAYEISGIAEQVKAAGGEMVAMSNMKFVSMDLPQAKSLMKSSVYDDALKADVLIDVPIAKDHALARLTLGMKNLMGLIAYREAIHVDMGQRLADLTDLFRPKLTVVDAVRMLMANGPTGGNLDDVKQANTIIASPDIVAADSYAATLFNLQPEDLSYIVAGTQRGLGRSDLKNLKIEEINVGA
ncbi:MAG TPA: DUF362 domain-containing protein [Anaerolineae bacterium]|nr:DUF362 domain-containing protein [Anaerolineae bacterium]